MNLYIAMCFYALTMSLSPGPVNLIALSSGVNQGLVKSIPFVLGASFGFIALFFFIGLGLGKILLWYPYTLIILKYLGLMFILYVSFLLLNAETEVTAENIENATFWQGVILQWFNPKAWVASIAPVSVFHLENIVTLIIFSMVYLMICFISILSWAGFGSGLQKWFNKNQRLQRFNQLMALLLFACAILLALN